MSDLSNQWSARLNPSQRKAVETIHGPLLVLAGAGSGKTRVLTYRMAQIVLAGEATPDEILALTFTNKAAKEMAGRIQNLLTEADIPVINQLWVTTFHSFCARILRDQIHHLGYESFFAIYDDSDQMALIKRVLYALNINDKISPPKNFKHKINEAKSLALSPSQVRVKAAYLMDDKSVSVYQEYENQLKKANALDFSDLLYKTYVLFRDFPNVLALYQEKFRFILIDEYQDTNRIQYLLTTMLAQKHKNLCVVGDEDQSIYSWRGADIRNILDFEKDFPNSTIVKLEENYRSTQTIVSAASQLIKHNGERKDKVLFTNNEKGSLIVIQEETNEYEEARFVVSQIIKLSAAPDNFLLSDFAIFYRTNAQSRVLEELLRSQQIPYKLIGGLKFYDRKEIKDIIAYLRTMLNPSDDMAIKRIINVPVRGIGKTTITRIEDVTVEHGCTFFEGIDEVVRQKLVHAGAIKKLTDFKELIKKLGRAHDEKILGLTELMLMVLDSTGYISKLKKEVTPDAQTRVENIEEFHNALDQFSREREAEATLQNFLEEMALVSDVDQFKDSDNCVTLMTLHVSKGLEFPNVFIVGVEDGLFPGARSFESNDKSALEEERRLAYVGMTRARKNLFLTHAKSRRVWGQEQFHSPSRFLGEIPKEYVSTNTGSSGSSSFLQRHLSSNGVSQGSQGPRTASRMGTKSAPGIVRRPRSQNNSENSWADASQAMPDYESYSDDEDSATSDYKKGMRVRHPTFGVGSIYRVEGKKANEKISVIFGDKTVKKFLAKYARLELLS